MRAHRKPFRKKDFPVSEIRRFLEPGPIVLVSSAWQGKTNIMTMGWHMVMGFSPSLVGCYIWDENHSFEMIRRSRQCVINVPTTDLINEAIGIGNCSGRTVDKFQEFGLLPARILPDEHDAGRLRSLATYDRLFLHGRLNTYDITPQRRSPHPGPAKSGWNASLNGML